MPSSQQQAELRMVDCNKPYSYYYSTLLKSFADTQTDHDQIQTNYKLEEFLSRLEDERVKIDAFKRELPLCMQLLTNAVEASRQQLQAFRSNQLGTRPVLEEFIPIIKHQNSQEITDQKAISISENKANWMTSAQLWSQEASELGTTKPQCTITSSPKEGAADIINGFSPKLALDNKHRNGGAFLPFSKERNSCQQGLIRGLPELALASSEKEIEEKKKCELEAEKCSKIENNCEDQGKSTASEAQTENASTNTTTTSSGQTHRKTRRCWSPDLHRRFVNALQMLGGSQVATPKQIRELMKVDGLTNDEVKSHLQKYRLHTRRPSPSLQTGAPTPQLVVLGGIWVPPEYASAAAAAATHSSGPTLYGPHPTSHVPPSQYCAASPMPQEFYNSGQLFSLPPPLNDHTLYHHHFHMYKTPPQPRSSPESNVRSGGDRSESIEDGKSESGSWKGESGEKKGLAALRDREGEVSTGSEITLKF